MDLQGWLRNKLMVVGVDANSALPGRDEPMFTTFPIHETLGLPINQVPAGCEVAYVAMGCYWGAEKLFWRVPGVVNTAVGFMGGFTPNPTYRETCTGRTGHTETVQIVFDPAKVSYAELIRLFFEYHDPTQLNRQGNDIGTQYRSAVFTTSDKQETTARSMAASYQIALTQAGKGELVTEIAPAGKFYYAEADHQQYLHKVPHGYDCHARTGIACALPIQD